MSGKSRGSDEIIRCNEDGSPMENWKKFQGSELGSLLAGIYGGTRPKINYPKPKQNKSAPNIKDSTWRAVSNKPDAVDPRKTTRRDTSGRLDVPKVNGGRGRSKLGISIYIYIYIYVYMLIYLHTHTHMYSFVR